MDASDEVNLAFVPIADAVQQFADAHALRVCKCVRGNVGWELTGPHAESGDITLLLLYNASHGLGIGSVWQYPCPEMSLLYSHFRPIRGCPLEPGEVVARLNSELQRLTKIRFGYWTNIRPLQPGSQDAT